MTWARLLAVALLFQGAATGATRPAPDSRPLPEPQPFFDAVRANLARSQDEQDRFAYKERRTELDLNPFGHIGTSGTRVFEVVPAADGKSLTIRTLERDGKPVTDGNVSTRPLRMTENGKRQVDDAVAVIDVKMNRREILDGRDAIVATFQPKKDAKPRSRIGRLVSEFKGEIWIDEEAKEVRRLDATSIDDLSYGFGVVGKLNEGATLTLRRQPIDDHVWLPVSLRFNGQGRELLVRKLVIDFAVDWFDYRLVR
jgi:hypothetical protein